MRQDTGVDNTERFPRWLIVGVIASSFGPYLTSGIRTDQVTVFALAVLLAVGAPSMWLRWRPSVMATNLLLVWGLYLAIGVIGSFGAPIISDFPPGSTLAGINRLAIPFAIMLVVWLVITSERREPALLAACRATTILTAINGVVALIGTRVTLDSYLQRFWGAPEPGTSVNELASQLGRISGVFNQPAEAGLMYSIAGVAAVYAHRNNHKRLYVYLIPIFIGGALCVSKVFLLGGAPIILWQVWKTARNRAIPLLVIPAVVIGISQTTLLDSWSGAVYLQRLVRPDSNVGYIDYYSAGRLGSSSSLTTVISQVMDHSPLLGFGARGIAAPYDNGWVEAMAIAGLVGAALYTLASLLLFALTRTLEGAERRLAWGLALGALIASVGVPALTANRSGAILWVLISLLAVRRQPVEPSDKTPSRSRLLSMATGSPGAVPSVKPG